ncbi:MAG: tRNA (adenosine(37)-N6)-threonylcarbamoyltransferase complex ATPase subunit type 1 TsaE [Calditrichia bacterium]
MPQPWTVVVNSPEESRRLAKQFAGNLAAGDTVAFYGELGSGKTFFIRALCAALNCRQEPTSPTFTIIQQYETSSGLQIYHFDFYRLENQAELQNLGLDEFFYSENICMVEWAGKIEAQLPMPRWEVHLEFVAENPQGREISIFKLK